MRTFSDKYFFEIVTKSFAEKKQDVRRKIKKCRYAAAKRATLGRYVATEFERSSRSVAT